MPFYEEEFSKRLRDINSEGLTRQLKVVPSAGGIITTPQQRIVNLSSNDYLNLATDPRLKSAAISATETYGTGATASRLMSGDLPPHHALENALATLCSTESALIFGSGFLANLGVLNAIARRQDLIIADKLNHASLIDGMLLSGAKTIRYRHCDMAHLQQILSEKIPANGIPIIVSDTIFSMDGDIAPVADLVDLARKYKAMLILDEAHAIGIYGNGGGVLAELGLCGEADFVMGTLSKALGSYGGFAACSQVMKDYLINRARSFIYSTGLPPATVAAATAAIEIVRSQPEIGASLLTKANFLRQKLANLGITDELSSSQILPVMTGDNHTALALAQALKDENILATAIRPPTVPAGTSRLRMSVTLAHSEDDLTRAAELIAAKLGELS